MDGLLRLNSLSEDAFAAALLPCCGSSRWARALARLRPFSSAQELKDAARQVWRGLGREDFLEAFSQHPRIGGKDALREKFAATRGWAQGEQSGAAAACEETLEALARGNEEYERRFGHIFIVCATGKSAEEMLALLRARLGNERQVELLIAAAEQEKITELRLEKMLGGAQSAGT